MSSDWALWLGLGLIVIGTYMAVTTYQRERQLWNGGSCSKCGDRWSYFATDSQNGLGFKCRCGRSCWISYTRVFKSG